MPNDLPGVDVVTASVMRVVPKFKIMALGLCRNRTAAEELMAKTLEEVLALKHQNFACSPTASFYEFMRYLYLAEYKQTPMDGDASSIAWHAFEVLPFRHREILLMTTILGIPIATVAMLTNASIGVVEFRKQRATRTYCSRVGVDSILPDRLRKDILDSFDPVK